MDKNRAGKGGEGVIGQSAFYIEGHREPCCEGSPSKLRVTHCRQEGVPGPEALWRAGWPQEGRARAAGEAWERALGDPEGSGSHCRTWSRDVARPTEVGEDCWCENSLGGRGECWGTGSRQLWSSGDRGQWVSRQWFLSASWIAWHTIKAALVVAITLEQTRATQDERQSPSDGLITADESLACSILDCFPIVAFARISLR